MNYIQNKAREAYFQIKELEERGAKTSEYVDVLEKIIDEVIIAKGKRDGEIYKERYPDFYASTNPLPNEMISDKIYD